MVGRSLCGASFTRIASIHWCYFNNFMYTWASNLTSNQLLTSRAGSTVEKCFSLILSALIELMHTNIHTRCIIHYCINCFNVLLDLILFCSLQCPIKHHFKNTFSGPSGMGGCAPPPPPPPVGGILNPSLPGKEKCKSDILRIEPGTFHAQSEWFPCKVALHSLCILQTIS